MSTIDLTAAMTAGSLGLSGWLDDQNRTDPQPAGLLHCTPAMVSQVVLNAALPFIREELAQQVEELSDVHPPGYFATRPSGLIRRERAARIVRGDRS